MILTARTALGLALAGMLFAFPLGLAVAADESLTATLVLPLTRPEPVAWGRDPFVPVLNGAGAPEMALKAVFYNPKRPSAIINAEIVYVGSVVNGQKVIDIGKTHVILLSGSGRVRLELASLPEPSDDDGKNR